MAAMHAQEQSPADFPPSSRGTSAHARRHAHARLFELALVLAILTTAALTLLAVVTPYFTVDLSIERAVQAPQASFVQTVATLVSWFGFPPQSDVLIGAVILALVLARRYWDALGVLVAAAGSAGVWYLVAPLVHRPRPTPDLVRVVAEIPYGSFPSGHVLTFTATFGFTAFLAWRSRHHVLSALLWLPPILVGLTRIYLGEHWPSDVLGGFLFGCLWLAVVIRLYRWAPHKLRELRGQRRESALAETPR